MSELSILSTLSMLDSILLCSSSIILFAFLIGRLRKKYRTAIVLNYSNKELSPTTTFQALTLETESNVAAASLISLRMNAILLPFLGSILVVAAVLGIAQLIINIYWPSLQISSQFFAGVALGCTILLFMRVYKHETRRQKKLLAVHGREIIFYEDKLCLFNSAIEILNEFAPEKYWNSFIIHLNLSKVLATERKEDWKYIDLPYTSISKVWLSRGYYNKHSDSGPTLVIDLVVVCRNEAYCIGRGSPDDEKYLARLEIILNLFRKHSVLIQSDNLQLV